MNLGKYTKFLVALTAFVAAVTVGLPDALSDGVLSGGELWQLIFAGLGAIGVLALPNKQPEA